MNVTLKALPPGAVPAPLKFEEPRESEYQADYYEKTIAAARLAAIGGFFMFNGFGALDYWLLPETYRTAWLYRFGVGAPIYLAFIILLFSPLARRLHQVFASAAISIAGVAIVLMIIGSHDSEPGHDVYFAGLILVHIGGYFFLNLQARAAAVTNLLILIAFEVAFLLVVGIGREAHKHEFLASNFFLVSANILGMWSAYRLDYFARRDFLLRRAVEAEQARSEELLLNILPEEIAAELKTEQRTIARTHEHVTILFADVVGFTPMTAGISAEELIDLLNDVFSFFDMLVEKHGVEKIKTIGDCYMAAAGVPAYRPDHAEVIARMALEIQDHVRRHDFRGRKLNFRIGINSGPVVAGVIGQKKFGYDLWGDTVNTASRMESHGEEGQIQITRSAYELLKGRFVCEPRGVIEVKGKGDVEVWYLMAERVAHTNGTAEAIEVS